MITRSIGLRATASAGGGAGNGPDGTENYVAVTIQASQVPSALTDFPVYVDMSDLPAAFFTNVQADGGDIRVTESDGATPAPVDLVSIDTGASTGELHFRASSLSASTNTEYRIYYNASVTLSQPPVGDTYGRNAVWSDYAGVWHLNEDPAGSAPQFTDATGNGNHGTANGSMTSGDSITGVVGQGVELDGTDDYINMGSGVADVANDKVFTVSSWVRRNGDSGDGFGAVSGKVSLHADTPEYTLAIRNSDHAYRGIIRDSGSDVAVVGGSILANATWHYLVMTGDGTNIEGLFDGTTEGTDDASLVGPNTGSRDFLLGRTNNPSQADDLRRLQGAIDEVRVSNTERSSDWISAEYTNQNTPGTFYSVGTEQAA